MTAPLTAIVLEDIKASILTTLEERISVTELVEYFKGSGEPTEIAWVIQAARELADAGKIGMDTLGNIWALR